MLTSLNKVILIGRVGDKIEFRHLENNGALCRFSIATYDTITHKVSGEKKMLTDWHKVTTWGDQAKEIYKVLKKDQLLYLEAKLKSQTWQSKEGVTHKSYELFLENYMLLAQDSIQKNKESQYSTDGTPNSPLPLSGFELTDLDELPF